MERHSATEVLVVGAGPAGMLTALFLAQGGVHVRVIDQASRTASRTYACALHPRSLALLERLGLAGEILSAGRRVETVAFYEGVARQAELKLSQLHADFPCVLVLAQSTLESLLEEKLRKEFRVQVAWNHQLSDLRAGKESVTATVDRLGMSAKGYIVPEKHSENLLTSPQYRHCSSAPGAGRGLASAGCGRFLLPVLRKRRSRGC